MPNIPISKATPQVNKPTASIPVTQPSASPSKKSIKSISGVRVGLKPAHNLEVFDLSSDKTQFLPFLVHCNTCSYEGHLATLDEAIAIASKHANV